MAHARSQLSKWVKLLERETGVKWTPTAIKQATGISRPTLYRWLNPNTRHENIDPNVVIELTGWLQDEFYRAGIPLLITPAHLYEYELETWRLPATNGSSR